MGLDMPHGEGHMHDMKVCLTLGVGLDGHPIVVRRSLRCARVLVWYLEVSPTAYKSRGGGARTLSSARNSSVFVTDIQTGHAQILLRRTPTTLRKSDFVAIPRSTLQLFLNKEGGGLTPITTDVRLHGKS